MKKFFPIAVICIVLMGCTHKYLPMVKTLRYYPPVSHAVIVDSIPQEAEYIGTIKLVPRDYQFETRSDKQVIFDNLKEAAAKAGANYIYITNLTAQSQDYYYRFFNAITEDWGEGFVLEAELYR